MTDTLGPYELRGELGRGAMAVVWRAWDGSLHREVALKEAHIPHGTPPEVAAELSGRFVREARAVAGLNHPGIVTVYSAEVYDERPVIAMEVIEGDTLSALLASGPLPTQAALGILDQLLDAIAYAHSKGIVHRDIKPDNIFVTPDGRVKLTDFGIAHVGSGTALTQAGTVMGTPGYMAPEQVTGQPVDARADIFSVGVVGYEMLTGQNPFTADGAHPTTVMYRVLNEDLPDVRRVLPEAPESLAALLLVATQKDPTQRFTRAQEMRAGLRGDMAVAMPGATATAGVLQATGPTPGRQGIGHKGVLVPVLGATILALVLAIGFFGLAAMDSATKGAARAGAVAPSAVAPAANGAPAPEPALSNPPIVPAPSSGGAGIQADGFDPATATAVASGSSPEAHVRAYYQAILDKEWDVAFEMQPAASQQGGTVADFQSTQVSYGLQSFKIVADNTSGDVATVEAEQDLGANGVWGAAWTFVRHGGGWVVKSRQVQMK